MRLGFCPAVKQLNEKGEEKRGGGRGDPGKVRGRWSMIPGRQTFTYETVSG